MTDLLSFPNKEYKQISQYFGNVNQYYTDLGMKGHNGIDIPMPVGTDIIASAKGTVLWIRYEPEGFGLHIKLEHEFGWTLYAHLSLVLVKEQQFVDIGELIAFSGNTGTSTGPHLHFGYKPKDFDYNNGYYGYIDPLGELS